MPARLFVGCYSNTGRPCDDCVVRLRAKIGLAHLWQETPIRSARPSDAFNGAAGQLPRQASVLLDDRGTPDEFTDLRGRKILDNISYCFGIEQLA